MSKTYTYMIVMTTMIIGLSLFGLIQGTSYSLFSGIGLTSNTLESSGFSLSQLFESVFSDTFGLLAVLATAGGIVAGYIANRDVASALRAGFALGLGTWVAGDMWSLFSNVGSLIGTEFVWMIYIVRFIIVVMFVGFIVSLVQFGTGND